jgi:cellulose biosynthesis protein BcsQ
MSFSILGEIAEFAHQLTQLFRSSPPEAVAVVVIGSTLVGFSGGVMWRRWRQKQSNSPTLPELGACLEEKAALESKLRSYSRVVKELEKDDADLWCLHPPKPPDKLAERLRASRTKFVLVGHLKGGVSKTTLLANLAAYFDGKGKRVLAIDFDYQGSLTATLIRAAGKRLTGPFSDILLTGQLKPQDLITSAEDLNSILPCTWLIPAAYTLVQKENQMLIRWLLNGGEADVRYHLVELLLSPEVQNAYDLVLIDMGPRLTTASVCALASATHVIVPTILDQLSAEAVGSFLSQVRTLTSEMKTGLNAVSVVGTMTRQQPLGDENKDAIAKIKAALQKWDGDGQMLSPNIPFKQAFIDCAGTDIAMLRDSTVRTIFEQLGAQVSRRIGL